MTNNKRILAENIYQRAFNFLAVTKDLNNIEAEVKHAIEVKGIADIADYVNDSAQYREN
jgi:hypothetical protein